jgi:hypothetical protein
MTGLIDGSGTLRCSAGTVGTMRNISTDVLRQVLRSPQSAALTVARPGAAGRATAIGRPTGQD